MSINYDKSENKPDIDIVYAKLTVSRQNKVKLELRKTNCLKKNKIKIQQKMHFDLHLN